MKTKGILSAAFLIMIFCTFNYSCKKTDDNNNTNDSLIGAHSIDADRAIPYSYANWMANIDGNTWLSEITIPGSHDCGADL